MLVHRSPMCTSEMGEYILEKEKNLPTNGLPTCIPSRAAAQALPLSAVDSPASPGVLAVGGGWSWARQWPQHWPHQGSNARPCYTELC